MSVLACVFVLAASSAQPDYRTNFGEAGDRPRVSEGLGLGRPIPDLIQSGDCRMMVIGDSISNRNTDHQNDRRQSSMYWAIVRTWKPDNWVGLAIPTRGMWPNTQLVQVTDLWATVASRSLEDKGINQNVFSYGYAGFATSPTRDVLWDQGDQPADQAIIMNRLMDGDAWEVDPWFDGALAADFVYLRTPETVGVVRAQADREGGFISSTDPIHPAGELGVRTISTPLLPAGVGLPRFSLRTVDDYNEHARPDHLIWLTTWIRRTDATGFSLNAGAVGGTGVRDFHADGRLADDDRLREYLQATGNPNLFYIQLGANDGSFPPAWKEQVIELVDRLDRLSELNGASPKFLLVGAYGTERRIKHARARMIAWYLDQISRSGTPRVDPDRIAMVSIAEILGGPIGREWQVDAIHPSRAGAEMMAELLWSQITRCRADVTGASNADDPTYGVPDGVLDASDFFYYLELFALRHADADLSGADSGVPDGVVNSQDFFYFLDLFAGACG